MACPTKNEAPFVLGLTDLASTAPAKLRTPPDNRCNGLQNAEDIKIFENSPNFDHESDSDQDKTRHVVYTSEEEQKVKVQVVHDSFKKFERDRFIKSEDVIESINPGD